MNGRLLLGLTGKTGAGKSTVAQLLASYGAYIVDGDSVAREVLVTDKSVIPALCDAFGEDIIRANELDRAELARRAFQSREGTEKLNSIMHPAITRRIDCLVNAAYSDGFVTAVADAAALIESGYAQLCDKLIVVTAPAELRLSRVMSRDGISEQDALVRINAQKQDSFYTEKADYIIRNYPPFKLSEELEKVKELMDGY